MKHLRLNVRAGDIVLLCGLALCASILRAESGGPIEQIRIAAGKTHLIDMNVNLERISVAAPQIAEAVPVSARTVMVNGKTPGETSLVLWLADGSRREYEIDVKIGVARLEAAQRQADAEFGGRVQFTVDNDAVYVTGTVKNLIASQRAVAIATVLGRVVNLLKVEVPPQEAQILLKVRFADVDRSRSTDFGINFVGAPKGFPFSVTTGGGGAAGITNVTPPPVTLTLSDSLNLLFWDPHIDVGATLKDLEGKAVLQILSEPNLLALNGHQASFVAGGEFPYPTLQGGGSGLGQVTVSFHEFGIKLTFLPTLTPRGTIRLHLTPEVSSLDYANALTSQGSTVPALDTRRVDTDIELNDGQTFAIAGLLDRRTTESLSRLPGFADIPVIGKLFTTKTTNRTNSELVVIVTPELVAPISDPKDVPNLNFPLTFLDGKGVASEAPRTPGADKTGPAPAPPKREEIPVQEMERFERDQQARQVFNSEASSPSPSSPGGVSAIGQSPARPLGGASTSTPAQAPAGQ